MKGIKVVRIGGQTLALSDAEVRRLEDMGKRKPALKRAADKAWQKKAEDARQIHEGPTRLGGVKPVRNARPNVEPHGQKMGGAAAAKAQGRREKRSNCDL